MLTIIHEHYNGFAEKVDYDFQGLLSFDEDYCKFFVRKKRNERLECFKITSDKQNSKHYLSNSYFIGVDWIIENEKAIYVEPKLNKGSEVQTNYLEMLFSALKHPEVAQHTDDLFEIKWNSPQIEISQQQDLLTPLLVVQFLKVVQHIVRKGLKKSYYKVEHNLHGKIKGKIMVGKTIKQNLLKNKPLNTYCSFDEFGFNGLENRLLKKAIIFVQHYLPIMKNLKADEYTTNVFNYINPAFENISDEVNLHDVKHTKTNVFYKEYEEAIKLAKIILQRFGYNISNIKNADKITTPPFWIDMSKLFELYVYAKLKEQYKNEVHFQFSGKGTYLDFLITKKGEEEIIDTKYKPKYRADYDLDDIRQLSGYARDEKVLYKLGFKDSITQSSTVVKCLVIYPDILANTDLDKTKEHKIEGFVKFHKQPIGLPLLNITN